MIVFTFPNRDRAHAFDLPRAFNSVQDFVAILPETRSIEFGDRLGPGDFTELVWVPRTLSGPETAIAGVPAGNCN